MKTKDIKDMASAYMQVLGLTEKKKLDPVGKEDGDIDNDGDKDKSDEYLMKRRKAISKNVKQDSEEMTSEAKLDELDKKTLGSYVKKASGSAAGVAAGIAGQAAITGKAHPDDKRQLRNRLTGISRATDKLTKEEVELDEISSDLKSRYAKKAQSSLKRATTYKAKAQDDASKASANIDRANSGDRSVNVNKQYDRIDRADAKAAKHDNTIAKRTAGLKRANEEVELDEAKWMVTHKKEQGTTGKYIDSTQFHPDERSARMHKGQLKHTPGVLKGSIKMKKVHYQDMAKEDTQWSVYNRILEKRDMHMKGATAPETMDDKFKGKGAKDAKNDIENGANWDDTAKKGMDDVAAAGRAGPSKKMRPGDQAKGDNAIINKPEDVTKKGGAE